MERRCRATLVAMNRASEAAKSENRMVTAAQCRTLANEYRKLAQRTDISSERAAILTNIARSLTRLATQHEILTARIRDEAL
jgi:hypothetical protein